MTERTRPAWVNYVILAVIVVLVVGAIYIAKHPSADQADVSVETPSDASITSVKVGDPAPEFKALDIDGLPFQLEDAAGKPLWLVFNATWCSACRAEIPEVQELASRDDLELVAIYMNETSDEVRPYVDKLGLEYKHLADPNAEVSRAYGISGVPSHVLIDGDGQIAYTKMGGITEADITEALANL